MRLFALLTLTSVLAGFGCGVDGTGEGTSPADSADMARTSSSGSRGGTIAIGAQRWTFVPSIQCSIYPGNVVSIAGHAEEDPSLEIVIDYDPEGGPVGVRAGDEGSAASWHSRQDTLQVAIDGRRVRGTATFDVYRTGSNDSARGSFEIAC